jgi:DUF1680 family protein
LDFADHLELVAYNALPTRRPKTSAQRQYFQCANQVMITRARRNFYEEDSHGGTDLCFGLLTGYPCCTCNMHQGWPKLTQNLWYATPDQGLAALVYAPSTVEWTVGQGVSVQITEETTYPFEETVRFRINPQRPVVFPLQLRVPSWATSVDVQCNGEKLETTSSGRLVSLQRTWKTGDVVTVRFGGGRADQPLVPKLGGD